MADESQQEVMVFATEEEKAEAIDRFDEKTGSIEDLQKIRDAEVKPPETEEASTEETTSETEEVSTEEKVATEEAAEEKPATQETVEETPQEPFTIKPEDLPEGMKTPGEVFKSFNEAQDLIKRQGEKIQKDQEQIADLLRQQTERADAAEAQLKATQAAAGEAGKSAAEAKEIPASKLSEIAALQKELSGIDDPFDEKAIEINRKLIPLMTEEIMRTTEIANNAISEAQTIKQSVDEYKNLRDTDLQNEKNRTALQKEYEDMDSFASEKEYKEEYGLSKSALEVDADYKAWRNKVALQYYGFVPDEMTEEGRQKLGYAMYMLGQASPDLVQKCKIANIPTVANNDMENYLKICDLMDFRDGIKYDPLQKKRIQLTRYDPLSRKDVPDRYPSLKAALEHKRVESGYYKDKMLDANRKGAESMADAVKKRDTKELENTTESRAVTQMSVDSAIKTIDNFDMEKARREYYQTGDASVFDDYNAARIKLGQPAMDLSTVATLK